MQSYFQIEKFTESDITEVTELAVKVWGKEYLIHGKEFARIMCEYIVRYGWLNENYAFKIISQRKMVGAILAGKISDNGSYNEWLEKQSISMTESQVEVANSLREYFHSFSSKVHSLMTDNDLYLSFFISAMQGCGKLLLSKMLDLCKTEGYKNIYLWTDSSCNHQYYERNNFIKVAEFDNSQWADSENYFTYIYKKAVL